MDDLEPALKKYIDNYLFKRFSKFSFDVNYPEVRRSDSEKQTGKMVSQDGNSILDFNDGQLTFSDGARDRVLLGNLQKTGKYGIRVLDDKGNVRFESSDGLEVVSMYDSTNTNELVRLDETGLTINSGKITIKDENDSTVIDSIGVVSGTTFTTTGTVNDALSQVISTTNYVDVTGATLDITLPRAALVLVLYKVSLYNIDEPDPNNCDGRVDLSVGGTVASGASVILSGGNGGNPDISTYSSYHIAEFPAGSTTIKLVSKLTRITGTGTMIVYNFKLSYLVLGT